MILLRTSRALEVAIGCALTMLVPTLAQQYRSGVELVTVPVVVTAPGRTDSIDGLTAADFRVFEDGVEQQVTLVSRERRPVSLCIVLDSSYSMRGLKQQMARRGIEQVVARLRAEDEAALVVFSTEIEVAMPWTPSILFPRIDWAKWQPDGTTRLIDALTTSIELMDEARNPRPVVLIVSDGQEAGSTTPLSRIVRTRRQSETLVYAIQTGDWAGRARDPDQPAVGVPFAREPFSILRPLVGDSGGEVYDAQIPERAEAAVRAFLDELDSHYTLGYAPLKAPDGKYRKLRVEATNKQWRVRHRGGYLALPVANQPRALP